jgi:HTH-type transcriptional regulator/antitoxin HigA
MSANESVPSPGSFIVYELERLGMSQRELAEIMGRPFQVLNDIIKGKKAITAETAIALGAALGTGPEIWLQREAAYQVSQATVDADAVRRRASLYHLAPIKEMEKRGWINKTKNANELEAELKRFFGVSDLATIGIGAAMRKTDADDDLTPSQRAWCFRVRQLAQSFTVAQYDPTRIADCKRELRKIAAYPQEVYKVPKLLGEFGIRFVVVAPLPGAKVDGVALWLDQDSPVIGMSLRYDRIDSFWFTLKHEVSHIDHRDESPLDADLTDAMEGITVVRAEMERRANAEAADALVPKDEMDSFVLRVGPLYSKEKIIKFAHRIKMHPGVIVGQLQRRHEIGYSANREMLSKIRGFVVSSSITDGWGHTINPRSIE